MLKVKVLIAISCLFTCLVAGAQGNAFFVPIPFRGGPPGDPFVFCRYGLYDSPTDPHNNPPCWMPEPPYSGQYTLNPNCRVPVGLCVDTPYRQCIPYTWSEFESLYNKTYGYTAVCPHSGTSTKNRNWKSKNGDSTGMKTPSTH